MADDQADIGRIDSFSFLLLKSHLESEFIEGAQISLNRFRLNLILIFCKSEHLSLTSKIFDCKKIFRQNLTKIFFYPPFDFEPIKRDRYPPAIETKSRGHVNGTVKFPKQKVICSLNTSLKRPYPQRYQPRIEISRWDRIA